MLLLPLLLPILCFLATPGAAAVPSSRNSAILFPGPIACTAPSGQPGVCVLPRDCPAERGPPSTEACGFERGSRHLKHCCEQTAVESVLPEDCGRGGFSSQGGIVPNIVNGRPAERAGWPWAAVVGLKQSDGSVRWLCGAALIGARHVLTAAHCLVAAPDELVVRLGEHDLRTADDGDHQDRNVSRAVRHPSFHRSQNDVALLELDRPAQLSDAVQPVCLPEPSQALAGRAGWVVGWGALNFEGPTASVLQEALVTVQPVDECEATFKQAPQYSFRFPDGFAGRVLCAASRRGMDSCTGDSGGPLSLKRPDGRYQVIGLVLEGIGCGSLLYPGLYTRVASYVDFIRKEASRS
ncbi:venom protease-like [Pollicipes pollicipes]|uniref:venom protease-like n=1 Tax=Pollicipes pollicipes TaxID=41117 RepID=UPI0018856400|nr:venom protease-like [Pollicipes pollicipes]